jgi:hypothetical protein
VPVPLPVEPDVTVTNGWFELAVHAQPLFAVTPTVAVAPVAATLNVVVDSVKVQVGEGCVGVRESESEHDTSRGRAATNTNADHARMDRA